MSGKDLFEAMSHVDERFVDEAEKKTIPRSIAVPWLKAVSVEACICLVLFGLYNLQPYLWGATEGIADEGMAPEGNVESLAPEDKPVGEIPNTILYVEEMTADGFIATVTDWGVTDVLGFGTQWNVIIREGSRHESATSHDSKVDYTGCYVLIQFYEFEQETGTIIADEFEIIEEG